MAGTLVANTINTDTGLFSTNNAYLGIAKAWASFNNSGTVAGSFNISSITNSSGTFTINFTTAMPNTNYAICLGSGANTVQNTACTTAYNLTTTSFNIQHWENNALTAINQVYFSIFSS
jgi:hypothetical protein